jgi:PAP2 superfamily
VTAESSAPGQRHAALAGSIGKIAVLAWPGPPDSPSSTYSGVRWVLAESWLPYQRKTFVTPAFPAFPSGHSTFSRAGAEILTRFTGSSYFPGGMGEYLLPKNHWLQFEIGPSTDVRLQWAQYYDAADQAGISRLWGGIHPAGDDFGGRLLGAIVGPEAWAKAVTYFDGSALPWRAHGTTGKSHRARTV